MVITVGSGSGSIMRIFPKMNWVVKADEILSITKAVLEAGVAELDRIGSIPLQSCSFRDIIWPLASLETTVRTKLSTVTFLQYVSPDESIRSASVEASKLLDKYSIEKETRQDLFKVTKCVAENDSEMNKLDDESKRLVEKMMLGFKHNGLFLDSETREQLKAKRKRMAELDTDFSKNMNEDKTVLLLTREELEGCPEDFIKGLEQDDAGNFILTMKYPDVFGVLKHANSEPVRKKMDIAFNSKCRPNGSLLEEAVKHRYECARILGYENHAAFQLEEQLAKESKAVLSFEDDLLAKLTPIAKGELSKLKEMKQKNVGADSEFYSWDYHYYSRQLLERDYSIDDELLKEYYSLDMVMEEMLKIYEEVLGLKFKLLTADDGASVWHQDVRFYEATNATDGLLVGHIYLDLFPRDGKYTHAACFDIQTGCWLDAEHAERQYPAAAMVANFSKPTATKPSLLKHDEVVTLFHELGHAMHNICAFTKYSRFHGTNVERDFVEAPSQMLENWCWDVSMLRRISKHYLRPSETLSEDTIKALVRAKNFNAGLLNLRQVFFGVFDMTIHSITSSDLKSALNGESIDQLYARLRRQIALIPQPEGVTPASSFGHLMGGYDAGYYGYLWSQVFSADMFYSRFSVSGLQDPIVGREYREKILQPGGSRDGMVSLVDFLGRKPTSDAFMKSLGIATNEDEFLEL